MKTKIYDVPAITSEDGRRFISAKVLKLVMISGFNNPVMQTELEIKNDASENNELDIRDFRAKVNRIFFDSLMHGAKPWKSAKSIIGEAPGFDICFDKEKLASHKDDIIQLLDFIKDIEKFSDLCVLKNGQKWTVVKQDIKKLLSLASASGLIDYHINKENYLDEDPKLLLAK